MVFAKDLARASRCSRWSDRGPRCAWERQKKTRSCLGRDAEMWIYYSDTYIIYIYIYTYRIYVYIYIEIHIYIYVSMYIYICIWKSTQMEVSRVLSWGFTAKLSSGHERPISPLILGSFGVFEAKSHGQKLTRCPSEYGLTLELDELKMFNCGRSCFCFFWKLYFI